MSASVAAAALAYNPRASHQWSDPNNTPVMVRLFRAQRGRCARCNWRLPPLNSGVHPHDPFRATVDHVQPRSKGGTRNLGNVVLLHKRCNEAKANDLPNGCDLLWLAAVNARLGVGA